VDGFHVVVDLEKSEGSWIVDAETGQRYLDCYSQFASQAFGWNYLPFLRKDTERLKKISLYKLANSDMYSHVYADFAEAFASITPDFKHYFFVEGGSCGVENALKAAFDWKCQVTRGIRPMTARPRRDPPEGSVPRQDRLHPVAHQQRRDQNEVVPQVPLDKGAEPQDQTTISQTHAKKT
jgi:hypothetical protein